MSEITDLPTLLSRLKKGQKEDDEELLKFEGMMEAIRQSTPRNSTEYALASAFLMVGKLTRAVNKVLVATWEMLAKQDEEIKALKGYSLRLKKLEYSHRHQAQFIKALLGLDVKASHGEVKARAKELGKYSEYLIRRGREAELEEEEKKKWT